MRNRLIAARTAPNRRLAPPHPRPAASTSGGSRRGPQWLPEHRPAGAGTQPPAQRRGEGGGNSRSVPMLSIQASTSAASTNSPAASDASASAILAASHANRRFALLRGFGRGNWGAVIGARGGVHGRHCSPDGGQPPARRSCTAPGKCHPDAIAAPSRFSIVAPSRGPIWGNAPVVSLAPHPTTSPPRDLRRKGSVGTTGALVHMDRIALALLLRCSCVALAPAWRSGGRQPASSTPCSPRPPSAPSR